MKRSLDRILTTHTGSLPRPADLVDLVRQADAGQPPDGLSERVRQAVAEIVGKEIDAGLDVVNDGEMGKPAYATYVKDRLTGFEGTSKMTAVQGEAADFPEWSQRRAGGAQAQIQRPVCNGPIEWKDFAAVERDIDNLKAAVAGREAADLFMTAASPGVVAIFLANEYFPSQEAYLEALATVMRDEYNAIHQAGFVLQLDCPDLAMSRHLRYPERPLADFRSIVEMHIQAINEATRDIPPDGMRMHLCWGNYEGPHHLDVPLKDIIDIVLKARPAGISFEGANPRHEHEWKVWQTVPLPPGKVIIPGVIDSTTNFIEHPELVAERIGRYAGIVGKENVIAGVDCGFGTFVGLDTVDPRIAWAKLHSLAEGARIASATLW